MKQRELWTLEFRLLMIDLLTVARSICSQNRMSSVILDNHTRRKKAPTSRWSNVSRGAASSVTEVHRPSCVSIHAVIGSILWPDVRKPHLCGPPSQSLIGGRRSPLQKIMTIPEADRKDRRRKNGSRLCTRGIALPRKPIKRSCFCSIILF